MSPKKAHEIVHMSAYLSALLSTSTELAEIEHAVDVGAGQVSGPFCSSYANTVFRPVFVGCFALGISPVR